MCIVCIVFQMIFLPIYRVTKMQASADFNVKNKHDHVNAEPDSNTLVFNSQPTSVACVSDMNALAGLRCAVD